MLENIAQGDLAAIKEKYPEFRKEQPVICRELLREYYVFLASTYNRKDVADFFQFYKTDVSEDTTAITVGNNINGFADALLLSQIKQNKLIQLPQETEKPFKIMQMAIYLDKKSLFDEAFGKVSIDSEKYVNLQRLATFMRRPANFVPAWKAPEPAVVAAASPQNVMSSFFSSFFGRNLFPGDHYESQPPSWGSINGDGNLNEKSTLLGKNK